MKTIYLNQNISKKDYYDFKKGHEFNIIKEYEDWYYVYDKLTDIDYWLPSEYFSENHIDVDNQ